SDLREEERLVAGSRDDAGEALNEREAVIRLGGRDSARGQRRQLGRAQRREERRRIARHRRSREVSSLLVVVQEVEQLVFLERTAEAGAELLPPILRLDADRREHAIDELLLRRERVRRAPLVVANVVEPLARHRIGAALGDGVDDATGRAAVLGRVIRGGDLELLDGRKAQG